MPAESILMFFPWNGVHPQDAFGGVRDALAARHWVFHSAETIRTDDGAALLHRSSRSAASVSALFDLLRPDGIVVWQDALSPAEVHAVIGEDLPVVFVDCANATDPPAQLRRGQSHTDASAQLRRDNSHTDSTDSTDASGANGLDARVRSDPDSIAAIAARVLLPSGYEDFAFVPNPVPLPWSQERGAAFERYIEVAGKRFHRFERNGPLSLERWLEALPKPCGVFTANDAVGEEVLGLCAQLGLAVPDDIAVIGVDDHAYFCEATTPTLSSIAQDLRAEGQAAVAMLAEMMTDPGRRQPPRFVPARGAVPRASTRFARDRRVARALEFIRLHACTEKFGPRDVVREMGVSRALADRLFRSVVGHTILEEIHAVRLARAKELLAAGTQPDIVAAECGYASHDDFRRVFRRRVGTTARQWALQRQQRHPSGA